ncbi:MAG TPA: HtaA domain-containing protein [Pseudolysinimonas sp.]|nr:HtaA domain-containing protein [Pseudolysinimonas sp.]
MNAASGDNGVRELVWTIKSSFLRYIETMPDGVISMYDGVTRDVEGFHFPLVSQTDSSWIFEGSVAFTGHFGMLAIEVGEVHIDVLDNVASLSIADGDERLVFATGTFDGSRFDPIALTADGADLFFEVYRRGEHLDPAILV